MSKKKNSEKNLILLRSIIADDLRNNKSQLWYLNYYVFLIYGLIFWCYEKLNNYIKFNKSWTLLIITILILLIIFLIVFKIHFLIRKNNDIYRGWSHDIEKQLKRKKIDEHHVKKNRKFIVNILLIFIIAGFLVTLFMIFLVFIDLKII
jgi:uncharacterized membrane protein